MAKQAASAAEAKALDAGVRVVLLKGPERFLHDLYFQRLREGVEEVEGEGGVEVVRFDGATASLADVLDECRSLGLMQQYKLVVVDNADEFVKSIDDEEAAPAKPKPEKGAKGSRARTSRIAARAPRELLQRYCESPSERATLVLRSVKWHPGNLDKAIQKAGAVVECKSPSPEEAVKWAIGRCKKRQGAVLEPAAAAALIEAVGCDLGRLATELAKLATARPGGPISADLVRELVGQSREEKFWEIQASLLSGDPRRALAHLRDLVEISRQDTVPLAWAYIDLARKLHGVSASLARGGNPGSLFREYKLFGSTGEAVMRVARRVRPGDAAEFLRQAVEMDRRQKSGLGEAVRGLEVLTLRFASLVSRPADQGQT